MGITAAMAIHRVRAVIAPSQLISVLVGFRRARDPFLELHLRLGFIKVLPPTGPTIGNWSKNGAHGGLQDMVKKWSKNGFGPLRSRAPKVVQKSWTNGVKMVAAEGRTI